MEYKKAYWEGDTKKAKAIFSYIYPDLLRVIKGVIFTHKMILNNNYDDLVSIAIMALLGKSGLAKFDPDYTGFKGKQENLLFSFISLITYRSVKHYNIICYKKDNELPLPENELEGQEDAMPSYLIEESDIYIRPKFKDTRLYPCYDYLIKYLKINGRFDKRDFFRMVCKMLNTDEDVITKVSTRLDKPITECRAQTTVRNTIKLYQSYLREYLEENNHGFLNAEKSTQ